MRSWSRCMWPHARLVCSGNSVSQHDYVSVCQQDFTLWNFVDFSAWNLSHLHRGSKRPGIVKSCNRSKLVNVVSGVPQGSVLGLLLVLLYPALFSLLENKLTGYADDSTLLYVVPFPGVRTTVAESLNRNLGKVSEWCDLRFMKLNACKTKTMIVLVLQALVLQLVPPAATIALLYSWWMSRNGAFLT